MIEIEEQSLRNLLTEVEHLREQNTQLQAAMTEMVERTRDESLTVHVSSFHHKFGYPVYTARRDELPESDIRFRLTLLNEEFFETMAAALGPIVEPLQIQMRQYINGGGRFAPASIEMNWVEFADGLGDIDYIVEGTRLTFGIPRVPIAMEIQRANMEKNRETLASIDAAKTGGWSKPLKPAGWRAPDIAGVLRTYGWAV